MTRAKVPTIVQWLPAATFTPAVVNFLTASGITLIAQPGKHGTDRGVRVPVASQAGRSDPGLLALALTLSLVTSGGDYQPSDSSPAGLLFSSNQTYQLQAMLLWDKSKAYVRDLILQCQYLAVGIVIDQDPAKRPTPLPVLPPNPNPSFAAWTKLVDDWAWVTPPLNAP